MHCPLQLSKQSVPIAGRLFFMELFLVRTLTLTSFFIAMLSPPVGLGISDACRYKCTANDPRSVNLFFRHHNVDRLEFLREVSYG